ncbi:hypothetical protein LT493_05905 [Streptomyces tricolor]|nr:hypothetical protein [Streptomyces tricolor]
MADGDPTRLIWRPCSWLTRALRASWRAKWTGVWLFGLSGWVGQDYSSPQGLHLPSAVPGVRGGPAGLVPSAPGDLDPAASRRGRGGAGPAGGNGPCCPARRDRPGTRRPCPRTSSPRS